VARAEAQVVRLATIYALLDCSDVIRKEHLEAALALWKFCEDSARYVFGNYLGDPVADQILKLLHTHQEEGVTRTQIRDHFGKHKSAAEIEKSLRLLEAKKLAISETQETSGRPVERWFICRTATKAT